MYGSLSWLPRTPNFGTATRSSVSSHAVCRSPRQSTAPRSCWRASTPASAWKGRSARASARIRHILPDERGGANAGRACAKCHMDGPEAAFRFLREFTQTYARSVHGGNARSRAEFGPIPAQIVARNLGARRDGALHDSAVEVRLSRIDRSSDTPHCRPARTHTTDGRGLSMRRRFAGALAGAGMLMLLGPGAAMANAGDVIIPGSQSQVDYHAEAAPAKPAAGGETIIGGNLRSTSGRGARGG